MEFLIFRENNIFIFAAAAIEKAVVIVGIFHNMLCACRIQIDWQFHPFFIAACHRNCTEFTQINAVEQYGGRFVTALGGKLHKHHSAFLVGAQKEPVKSGLAGYRFGRYFNNVV